MNNKITNQTIYRLREIQKYYINKQLSNADEEWYSLIQRNGGVDRVCQFFRKIKQISGQVKYIIASLHFHINRTQGNYSLS